MSISDVIILMVEMLLFVGLVILNVIMLVRGFVLSRHIRKQPVSVSEVRRSDNADFSHSFSRDVYYILSVSWEDENGTHQVDVNTGRYSEAKRCQKKETAFVGIVDENPPKLPMIFNHDLFRPSLPYELNAGTVILWSEYENQKNTTDIFSVVFLFPLMIDAGIVFFANLASIIVG